MPIAESDILYKLSTTSGSAGDSLAQADPDASLGKYISTTELSDGSSSDGSLNNLFDDVSGDENAAEDVEYRCLFVHNNHATLTLQGAVVWVSSETAGGCSFAIGLDPAGVVAVDATDAQAAVIASESSAPSGVSFSAPGSKGAGLAIGDLDPGECQAIWIRRTANDTGAVDNDGVTIKVEGDTSA